MNIEEEMQELYALKHIIRYNNLPRILVESVAEHSFFVTLTVARLAKKYKFNIERALIMATVHDIFEIFIGDTPRNIKNQYKDLDKALMKAENDVIKDKYPEYEYLLEEFNTGSTPEGLIVKYADSLSVLLYAKTEIRLGSQHYMPGVAQDAENKLIELKSKLEVFKR